MNTRKFDITLLRESFLANLYRTLFQDPTRRLAYEANGELVDFETGKHGVAFGPELAIGDTWSNTNNYSTNVWDKCADRFCCVAYYSGVISIDDLHVAELRDIRRWKRFSGSNLKAEHIYAGDILCFIGTFQQWRVFADAIKHVPVYVYCILSDRPSLPVFPHNEETLVDGSFLYNLCVSEDALIHVCIPKLKWLLNVNRVQVVIDGTGIESYQKLMEEHGSQLLQMWCDRVLVCVVTSRPIIVSNVRHVDEELKQIVRAELGEFSPLANSIVDVINTLPLHGTISYTTIQTQLQSSHTINEISRCCSTLSRMGYIEMEPMYVMTLDEFYEIVDLYQGLDQCNNTNRAVHLQTMMLRMYEEMVVSRILKQFEICYFDVSSYGNILNTVEIISFECFVAFNSNTHFKYIDEKLHINLHKFVSSGSSFQMRDALLKVLKCMYEKFTLDNTVLINVPNISDRLMYDAYKLNDTYSEYKSILYSLATLVYVSPSDGIVTVSAKLPGAIAHKQKKSHTSRHLIDISNADGEFRYSKRRDIASNDFVGLLAIDAARVFHEEEKFTVPCSEIALESVYAEFRKYVKSTEASNHVRVSVNFNKLIELR